MGNAVRWHAGRDDGGKRKEREQSPTTRSSVACLDESGNRERRAEPLPRAPRHTSTHTRGGARATAKVELHDDTTRHASFRVPHPRRLQCSPTRNASLSSIHRHHLHPSIAWPSCKSRKIIRTQHRLRIGQPIQPTLCLQPDPHLDHRAQILQLPTIRQMHPPLCLLSPNLSTQ